MFNLRSPIEFHTISVTIPRYRSLFQLTTLAKQLFKSSDCSLRWSLQCQESFMFSSKARKETETKWTHGGPTRQKDTWLGVLSQSQERCHFPHRSVFGEHNYKRNKANKRTKGWFYFLRNSELNAIHAYYCSDINIKCWQSELYILFKLKRWFKLTY